MPKVVENKSETTNLLNVYTHLIYKFVSIKGSGHSFRVDNSVIENGAMK